MFRENCSYRITVFGYLNWTTLTLGCVIIEIFSNEILGEPGLIAFIPNYHLFIFKRDDLHSIGGET